MALIGALGEEVPGGKDALGFEKNDQGIATQEQPGRRGTNAGECVDERDGAGRAGAKGNAGSALVARAAIQP